MKYYHFTAKHLLGGILQHGIRFGKIPIFSDGRKEGEYKFRYFIKGYQWLTTNPDFDQAWAKQTYLKYNRTDYRLQIVIKHRDKNNLIKWTEYLKKHGDRIPQATVNALKLPEGSDPENWYLYKGVIRPSWIMETNSRAIEEGVQNMREVRA